jgi:type IX secretion system PorP/SprF family membrane protein
LAGVENYSNIQLGTLQQWTGFNAAPQSQFVSYNAPFKEDSIAAPPKSNSMVLPTWNNTKVATSKEEEELDIPTYRFGYGFNLISERNGTLGNNIFNSSLALHKVLRNKNIIAMGVSAGLMQLTYNPANLQLLNAYDITFARQANSQTIPTLNLATTYYSQEFFLSVTAGHVFKNGFTFDRKSPFNTSDFERTYNLAAGLKLKVNKEISVLTSALFRKTIHAPANVDISAIANYKAMAYLGATFRTNGDIIMLTGYTFKNRYSIYYSFDFSNSKLRTAFSNTHTIVLAVKYSRKKIYKQANFHWI